LIKSNCVSSDVDLGNGVIVTKNDVAMTCVTMDLIGMYFMFFSLIYLKYQQEIVSEEVDCQLLTADDFSVVLKVLPKKLNRGNETELLALKA
jgi:hypothetical protein